MGGLKGIHIILSDMRTKTCPSYIFRPQLKDCEPYQDFDHNIFGNSHRHSLLQYLQSRNDAAEKRTPSVWKATVSESNFLKLLSPTFFSLGISRANQMLHTLNRYGVVRMQLIEIACAALLRNMHPGAQISLASRLIS